MKFKGEHQDVTLRGIELAGSDRAVAAGGMNELVGLVERDGKWEPYGLTYEYDRSVSSGVKQFLVHKTSYGDNVLQLQSGGNLLWMSKADFESGGGTWKKTGLTGVTEVALVGNMITDQNINSVVFVNDAYESYDATLNELDLPSVQLRVSCDHEFVAKKAGENGTGSRVVALGELQPSQPHNLASADTLYKNEWTSSISGLAAKAISECAKKGGLSGYTMAVVAYRLMNGEYILASMPILLGEPFVRYKDWYKVKEINASITYDGTDMSYSSLVPKDLYSKLEDNGVRLNLTSRNKNDLNIVSDDNYFLLGDYNNQNTDLTNSYYRSPSLDGLVNYFFKKESSKADIHEYTGIVTCKGNALEYKISSNIDNRYKKVIDSVCIFLSKTICGYNISANSIEPTNVLTFEHYQPQAGFETITKAVCYHFLKKSSEDIQKELKEIDAFYKVKEIPFDEITAGNDWVFVDLEGKLGDSLYTLPTLPISAFNNSKMSSGKLFTYNNRIHVYGYESSFSILNDFRKHIYFGGYGQWENGSFGPMLWRVIAKCYNESYGEYTLDSGVVSGSGIPSGYLNGTLFYPNADCYEMEVRVKSVSMATARKKIFRMVKWKDIGLSVYWSPTSKLSTRNISGVDVSAMVEALPEPINWYDDWDEISDIGTPSSDVVKRHRDNAMRVSDVAFPFFPNAQTYTIGKSKIIGLAHLSVPLSQDSYAKTALIVFCDDGIYTLGVDATGKLAYDTITPFVPEVCTSRNSICMLGGEVLFVSRRGLMTCTDKSVDYFCPKAMGELNHSPRDPSAVDGGKYGTGLNIYYNALHTLALTHEGASAVDGTSFEEFIHDENTVISLLATKRSVLVYNKRYNYSYLIDIVTRTVSKLPQKIIMDDKNYPEQIFFDGNKAHSAGIYSGVDNTQCIFQTRPLYMGGILRRSFRVLLRGDFRGYSGKYAGIYVLGSLDGEHWKLMGAKEKQLSADGFHDLGCETYRDEVAYLMVIFVGYLHKSSHIDKMEVDGMYN